MMHYNVAGIHKTLTVAPGNGFEYLRSRLGVRRDRSSDKIVTMPNTPIDTWSGGGSFKYSGSVDAGLQIYCGERFSRRYTMTAIELRDALRAFSEREVKIGTPRTAPPDGSIGDWIRRRFSKGGIMSDVGPILIAEGYAERCAESDHIEIKRFPS
jgi:hypothetical protein